MTPLPKSMKSPLKKTILRMLATTALSASLINQASAADYFISPKGSDTGKGTSAASPWATLEKVNQTTFRPGDRILFQSGGTWTGQLWPKGSGDAGSPITLGSYGSGAKPIIDAKGVDGTAAIKLFNQEYWTIKNMEVCNWASTYGSRWGISISADDGEIKHGFKIIGNTVRDVYASPIREPVQNATFPSFYNVGGIFIKITKTGRADGVLIEGNRVTNIIGEGIVFWGQFEENGKMNYKNCSPHVVVRKNMVSRTAADGILILGTDDELVEHNLVEYAGTLGVTGSGGTHLIAGMWPTRHVNGLWQFNEVHHTKRWDGDGQGLDSDLLLQGTAVFQYNYSHDNEGGFFLDCVNPDGGQTVVRYNLSKNDGNLGDFRRENALVYNNIFYAPDKTLASDFGGRSGAGNIFDNNIFWCAGLTGGNKQVFSHNSYFGGVTPKPGDDHAITSDPKFVNPTSAE
jgi:hypothetical protein